MLEQLEKGPRKCVDWWRLGRASVQLIRMKREGRGERERGEGEGEGEVLEGEMKRSTYSVLTSILVCREENCSADSSHSS